MFSFKIYVQVYTYFLDVTWSFCLKLFLKEGTLAPWSLCFWQALSFSLISSVLLKTDYLPKASH